MKTNTRQNTKNLFAIYFYVIFHNLFSIKSTLFLFHKYDLIESKSTEQKSRSEGMISIPFLFCASGFESHSQFGPTNLKQLSDF